MNTSTLFLKILFENHYLRAEIQRLTELLHEKLSRQSSRMVDGAKSSENILETHHAGVSNIYIRLGEQLASITD